MHSTITQVLSDYVHRVDFRQLPPEVVDKARILFADWIACAVAGTKSETAERALRAVQEDLAHGSCTIVGTHRRSTPLMAAFVNGFTSHIWEYDDTHRNSLYHPAAPTIPAALAAAEQERASGEEFLAGLVAGYDVGIRIADAVNPAHYRFWHTTGTVGAFAAAAAAGRVLRLAPDEIVNALGNAGSQAAGLWEFQSDGAMTKPLHPGKAAMSGLLSAKLARQGFTGALRILEGDQGFCRATAGECDLSRAVLDLGSHYRILEVTTKMYPSCGHTHTPIDAAVGVRRRLSDAIGDSNPSVIAGIVRRIVVRTNSVAVRVAGISNPSSSYEAKFSIPFCVSHGLLYGSPALESFEGVWLDDTATRQLMQRVSITIDPELEKVFRDKRPTEIQVELNDGRVFEERVEFRRGDPENPVSKDTIREKFMALAGRVIDPGKAESLWNACMRIDTAPDMSQALLGI